MGAVLLTVVLVLSSGQAAGADAAGGESIAAAARDPTAPVTAFQIQYRYTSSFHNLPDADQGSLVLQPIVPWKWGEQRHITRVTVPYVTSGPDWGQLADSAATGIPPNFTPTGKQEGLADIAAVDLLIFDADWGRWGVGAATVLPTASDPALGSEKWSVGPAFVAITTKGAWQMGALAQWLVSVAGESDRDDVNTLTLQPFGGYGFGKGWSVQLSEAVYNYDIERGRLTSIPLGLRVEKLVQIGDLPVRLYAEYEYNFKDSEVSPENIFRIAVVPLL
jgi:hypothetical protein